MSTVQPLDLDKLKIGMRVTSEQLSKIYNMHFVLLNPRIIDDGNVISGDLAWFGAELNDESERFSNEHIACIYNTDDPKDGEVYYEE